MNKARAFNPFLCAATDNLKALITEVQVQMSGYEFFTRPARELVDQLTKQPMTVQLRPSCVTCVL